MNREDFMSFVEKNIKFHLPESFATCRFEADVAKNTAKQPKKTAEFTPRM